MGPSLHLKAGRLQISLLPWASGVMRNPRLQPIEHVKDQGRVRWNSKDSLDCSRTNPNSGIQILEIRYSFWKRGWEALAEATAMRLEVE